MKRWSRTIKAMYPTLSLEISSFFTLTKLNVENIHIVEQCNNPTSSSTYLGLLKIQHKKQKKSLIISIKSKSILHEVFFHDLYSSLDREQRYREADDIYIKLYSLFGSEFDAIILNLGLNFD